MPKLSWCLTITILALIVVGLVSGTLARHLIQIIPVIIALTATLAKKKWSVFAAFPLFIYWLLIMIFIWLFLLKIANITRGHFTKAEIEMTILIGICCVYGIVVSIGRLSIRGSITVVFILWNVILCFALMYFFNTLVHTLPGYSRTLKLALSLLFGTGITLLLIRLFRKSTPVFNGRNILATSVLMLLQTGALTLSYL